MKFFIFEIVMKNFVIIGTGPIGLYWAARLALFRKERGLSDISIVAIDPQAGDFQRQRIVSNEAINKVTSTLGIQISPSKEIPIEAMRIRDFESALFDYCIDQGVDIILGKFQRLENDAVVYQDSTTESNVSISCDMVIDCSGTSRVVLKGFNTASHQEFFKIQDLGNNPHRSHFHTYLILKPIEAAKLSSREVEPLIQAEQLCKLRETYNWPDFSFPEVYINSAERKDGRFNYFIYYEAPDNLREKGVAIQESFLKDLLKLKFGFDNITIDQIVSHGNFPVSPKYVEPVFYMGDNFPAVFPGGDCQIEPDYRKGFGIESGIKRADFLLDTISITPSGISFRLENYNFNVSRYISYQTNLIVSFYQDRTQNIQTSLEKARLILCAASKTVEDKEKIKLIATHLKQLGNELFKKPNFIGAQECYLAAINLYQQMDLDKLSVMEDLLALYSNASLVSLKQKDYEGALKLAEKGIEIAPHLLKGNDIFYKLLYRKVSAILEILDNQNEKISSDIADLRAVLFDTYAAMKNHPSFNKNALTDRIEKQIELLESSVSHTSSSAIKPPI